MSAPKPWLSVVTPVYKGERWLGDALSSVVAEGAEGVEILLIDSSPTSETLDIARSFSDRLNLRIFERPDFSMWHAKTNFAVECAGADHVCWLHHDDLWLAGRVAAARSWIERAPRAALHIAPSAIIDENGRRLGVWRCPLSGEGETPSRDVVERLLVQNFIAAPAPIFRKDAWLACGGLDEALWYTADWDIWLALAAQGPVCFHDAVTTAFRVHGASLTVSGSRDIEDFIAQMRIVLERHLPRLGGADDVESVGRASIAVNAALACASAGDFSRLWRAAAQVAALGPAGAKRYLRDSRIVDRLAPRARARLAGAF